MNLERESWVAGGGVHEMAPTNVSGRLNEDHVFHPLQGESRFIPCDFCEALYNFSDNNRRAHDLYVVNDRKESSPTVQESQLLLVESCHQNVEVISGGGVPLSQAVQTLNPKP